MRFQQFGSVRKCSRLLIGKSGNITRCQSTLSASCRVDPLVSTEWLSSHLPKVIPIDATCYFKPSMTKEEESISEESVDPKRAFKEFLKDHIQVGCLFSSLIICKEGTVSGFKRCIRRMVIVSKYAADRVSVLLNCRGIRN